MCGGIRDSQHSWRMRDTLRLPCRVTREGKDFICRVLTSTHRFARSEKGWADRNEVVDVCPTATEFSERDEQKEVHWFKIPEGKTIKGVLHKGDTGRTVVSILTEAAKDTLRCTKCGQTLSQIHGRQPVLGEKK